MMKSKCVVCHIGFVVQILKSSRKTKKTEEEDEDTEFGVFCNYFKYPLDNDNNYYQEPIPSFFFCPNCRIWVERLFELDHKVKFMQSEIRQIISNVSYKIIETTTTDPETDSCDDDDDDPVSYNEDLTMEISRFRQFIFQSYQPQVKVTKCKPTANQLAKCKSLKVKPSLNKSRNDKNNLWNTIHELVVTKGRGTTVEFPFNLNHAQDDTDDDEVMFDSLAGGLTDDSYEGAPFDSDVQICSNDEEYTGQSARGRKTRKKKTKIGRKKSQGVSSVRKIRAKNYRKRAVNLPDGPGHEISNTPHDDDYDGEQQQQQNELDDCSDGRKNRKRKAQKRIIVDKIADVLQLSPSEDEGRENSDSDFNPDHGPASPCSNDDGADEQDTDLKVDGKKRRRSETKRRRIHVSSKISTDGGCVEDRTCERCNVVLSDPRQLKFHVRDAHADYYRVDLTCPFCKDDPIPNEDQNPPEGGPRQKESQSQTEVEANVIGFNEMQPKVETDGCEERVDKYASKKSKAVQRTGPFDVHQLRKHIVLFHSDKSRQMWYWTIKVNETGMFLYKRHCLFQERGDKLECLNCGEITEGLEHQAMLNHLDSRHILPLLYMCDQCGKAFRSDRDLKRHQVAHQTETPYMCEVCGSWWKSEDRLKKHAETHINSGCGKTGKRKKSLEGLTHQCPKCPRKFQSEYHVNLHLASAFHQTEGEPFKCPHCPKTFSQSYSIKRHVRLWHSGGERVKNCPCPECGKLFFSKPEVKQHLIRCPAIHGNGSRNVRVRDSDSTSQPLPPPPSTVDDDHGQDSQPSTSASSHAPTYQDSRPASTSASYPPGHPLQFPHPSAGGINNETVQNCSPVNLHMPTRMPVPPTQMPMRMPTQTPIRMPTEIPIRLAVDTQLDPDVARWFFNL